MDEKVLFHPSKASKVKKQFDHCSRKRRQRLHRHTLHTTVQVLSHFCGQASSLPQAPTMEQKISPLGQSPWVCRSLMSPSTKMLSHSWNLWRKKKNSLAFASPASDDRQECVQQKTHLPQFKGSTKVPGDDRTGRGSQRLQPFPVPAQGLAPHGAPLHAAAQHLIGLR